MIPLSTPLTLIHTCKPRASGDDPAGHYCDAVQCAGKPRASGDDPKTPVVMSAALSKPRASGDDPWTCGRRGCALW